MTGNGKSGKVKGDSHTRRGSLKLTDNEKRDIIKLLEADRPLPDKYRFLLFDDKREVELVWNGKGNEVCNIVLPFQTKALFPPNVVTRRNHNWLKLFNLVFNQALRKNASRTALEKCTFHGTVIS